MRSFHKMRNRGCNTGVFVFSNILCFVKKCEDKNVSEIIKSKRALMTRAVPGGMLSELSLF